MSPINRQFSNMGLLVRHGRSNISITDIVWLFFIGGDVHDDRMMIPVAQTSTWLQVLSKRRRWSQKSERWG